MLKTPLAESHEKAGAKMVDFSGWYMPVQYDGIVNEHNRTRTEVTMFDTCHMGRFMLEGAGSEQALDKVLTADIPAIPAGKCKYGFLLKDDGGILDDLITYKLGSDRLMIVVNAGTRDKDFNWMKSHLPASGLKFTNHSESMSKLDVQGPKALDPVQKLLGADLSQMKYFSFITLDYHGTKAIVSRTGYTGEFGFELYVDTSVIVKIWDELMALGVKPAGLGARDTLRLESGMPLYGHELTEEISPVEANMARYANKQADFIGKSGMAKRQQSFTHIMTGFVIKSRQSARNGNKAVLNGKEIGWVTSGSFAPSLGYSVGIAYLKKELVKPGFTFSVDTGRSQLEAVTADMPFFSKKPKK